MDDYEFGLFNGKCPYTDEPCTEKIPCNRCRANKEERKLMEMLEKQERVLEIYDD